MAGSNFETNVPPLTRFVRACALLAAQGAAVGFAGNTLSLWARLPEFVSNNRISLIERKHILLWLIAPVFAWVIVALVVTALRSRVAPRLLLLEGLAHRCSWVIVLGLVPVLLHPTLWRSRTLMFLIATGAVTLGAWWAIRLTQRGRSIAMPPRRTSDFQRILTYLALRIPTAVKVLTPIFVIAAAALYVVLRGVWLDPTAVPKLAGEPAVSVHSLRQAFLILGHAGWLGIPVAMLKFLRPPGHAHVFFWALCIASAALPLYAWARTHLGAKVALIVALAYLSMPVLRTVGRAEVLPLGAAAGLFFFAALTWERRNYHAALIVTLLTVGVHEQAAWWFFCLGIYMVGLEATRTAGRWLTLGSIAYFVVVALVLLPRTGLQSYGDGFKGLWGAKAVGLFETARVAVSNPAYVLTRWIDSQDLSFWLAILVPFAFLPVSGKNWLSWMLPGAVFAIVANGRAPSLPVTAGIFAHFIVLGFAASVTTLKRLRSNEWTREQANAAVVAWIVAILPCSYQMGGLWAPAP